MASFWRRWGVWRLFDGDHFGFGPVVAEAEAVAGVAAAGEEDVNFDETGEGDGQEDVPGGARDPIAGEGGAIFFNGLGLHNLLADALAFQHGEAVPGEEDEPNGDPLGECGSGNQESHVADCTSNNAIDKGSEKTFYEVGFDTFGG